MEAKEAHVSVVLHIKCDERYPSRLAYGSGGVQLVFRNINTFPSSTPMVQLLQPKGLSDAVMKKCQKSLELQVLRLKGQVGFGTRLLYRVSRATAVKPS